MNDVIDMATRSARLQTDREDTTMILLMQGVLKFNTEYTNMIQSQAPGTKQPECADSIITEVLVGLQQATTFADLYLKLPVGDRQKILQAVRGKTA